MGIIKYDNILFDLDDTLFDYHLSERFALKEALCHFNINIDSQFEDVYKTYRHINRVMWKEWESQLQSDMSTSSFYASRFKTFFDELNISLPLNDFIEIYNGYSSTPFLIDGAEYVCSELSKFAKIYIVSNGPKEVRDNKVKRSTISQYIVESFYSEIIGFNKPDVNYFNTVFRKIPNFSHQRTIIIGDKMETDILGGIIANIDTCLFVKKPAFLNNYSFTPKYVIGKLKDLVDYIIFE